MQIKTCGECASQFPHDGTTRAYCSPECTAAAKRRRVAADAERALERKRRKRAELAAARMQTKTCTEFGTEFQTVRASQKSCSATCTRRRSARVRDSKHIKVRTKREPVEAVPRPCVQCGNEYTNKSPRILTCSKDCSRQRKMEVARLRMAELRGGGTTPPLMFPVVKTCSECDASFSTTNQRKLTCGDDCYAARRRRIKAERYEPKQRKVKDSKAMKQTPKRPGQYRDFQEKNRSDVMGFDMGLTRWVAPPLEKPEKHVVAPDLEQVIHVRTEPKKVDWRRHWC